MTYSNIVDKVSKELNIPRNIVDKTYKSYWRFIKDSIQSLPLKKDLSEEEFNKLNTSFNISSIGKISVTWARYMGVKQEFNYTKYLREKKNAKHKED